VSTQKPLEPKPHWVAVDGKRALPNRGLPPFLHRDDTGQRFRIRYFSDEQTQHFCAIVWFGPETEGPPGHAHGGSIAAVLDEAMGFTAWYHGHRVLAGHLSIDFLRAIPVNTEVWVECWIERVDDKKITVRGMISIPDETLYAQGKGLFVELSEEQFQTFFRSSQDADDM
jgi:acyl-coenzyme A thioesterase PaaI-like protein